MGKYEEWFKFGVVRGLIAFSIAAILSAIARWVNLFEYTTTMSQMKTIMDMGTTTPIVYNNTIQVPVIDPVTIAAVGIISFVISLILSGLMYSVGAYVTDALNLKVSGYTKAVTSGVIGLLILIIPSTAIAWLMLTSLGSTVSVCQCSQTGVDLQQNLLALLVLTLPVSIILEVAYAGITWIAYTKAGWRTPA